MDLHVHYVGLLNQITAFEPEYKDGVLQNEAVLKQYVEEFYERLVALVQEKHNESRISDSN